MTILSDRFAPGFKRLHTLPRRYRRHGDRGDFFAQLCFESPRQRHIRQQSASRFAKRPDAYLPSLTPMRGEFGTFEGFRIITGQPRPLEWDGTIGMIG